MRQTMTLAIILLFTAMPTHAALITFGFEGTVTHKFEAWKLCATCAFGSRPTTRIPEVPLGSVFSGWYSFDTSSADRNPQDIDDFGIDWQDGTLGSYDLLAGQVELNGFAFDLLNRPNGLNGSINIANNYIIGDAYSFIAGLSGPLLSDHQGDTTGFLVDYPNVSDALTGVPPGGFSSSDSRPFNAQFVGGRNGRRDDVSIRGRFQRFFLADNPNPVPLPSSVLLVLMGLGLLGLRRA